MFILIAERAGVQLQFNGMQFINLQGCLTMQPYKFKSLRDAYNKLNLLSRLRHNRRLSSYKVISLSDGSHHTFEDLQRAFNGPSTV